MTIRSAEKAGSWYPADKSSLIAMLDSFLGCGENKTIEGTPVAGIVPHAGLVFSGLTAARTYQALTTSPPETIILFGAVHTMPLTVPAIWGEGAWDTPLGRVEVNTELALALQTAGVGEFNELPHLGDNSIELQMPFIKHCFPEATIVPIAIPPHPDMASFGTLAWTVASQVDRKVVALGSTDLTHYGSAFGVTPAGFGEPALEWTAMNDDRIIQAMLSLEAEKVFECGTRDHSACGAGAAAATTAFAASAGATATLLEYTTSHHVRPEGEAQHFVGYASIIFSR